MKKLILSWSMPILVAVTITLLLLINTSCSNNNTEPELGYKLLYSPSPTTLPIDFINEMQIIEDYLVVVTGYEIKVWHVPTRKLVQSIYENSSSKFLSAIVDFKKNRIVAGNYKSGGHLIVYDLTTGEEIDYLSVEDESNYANPSNSQYGLKFFREQNTHIIMGINDDKFFTLKDEEFARNIDANEIINHPTKPGIIRVVGSSILHSTIDEDISTNLEFETDPNLTYSGMALDSDSKYLYAITNSNKIVKWDLESGDLVSTFGDYDEYIRFVLSIGENVYTSDKNGTLRVYNKVTEKLIDYNSDRTYLKAVAFGDKILIADYSQVFIIDKELNILDSLRSGFYQITDVALSNDRSTLVAGTMGNSAFSIDLLNGQQYTSYLFQKPVRSVATSNNGSLIFAGMYNSISGIETSTNKELFTRIDSIGTIKGITYSDETEKLLYTADGTYKIMSPIENEVERKIKVGNSDHQGTVFNQGDRMALGGNWNPVGIWGDKSDVPLSQFAYKGEVFNISTYAISKNEKTAAVIPSGDLVVDGDGELAVEGPNKIMIYTLDDMQYQSSFSTEKFSIQFLKYLNDSVLVGVDYEGRIRAWDAKTGNLLSSIQSHRMPVENIVVIHETDIIVTASWDGSLGFWDLKNNVELGKFISHSDGINWIFITPDGLYDGSKDVGTAFYVSNGKSTQNIGSSSEHIFVEGVFRVEVSMKIK